jgi:hypothetical protein
VIYQLPCDAPQCRDCVTAAKSLHKIPIHTLAMLHATPKLINVLISPTLQSSHSIYKASDSPSHCCKLIVHGRSDSDWGRRSYYRQLTSLLSWPSSFLHLSILYLGITQQFSKIYGIGPRTIEKETILPSPSGPHCFSVPAICFVVNHTIRTHLHSPSTT